MLFRSDRLAFGWLFFLTVVVLIIMLWCFLWKGQMMYNSSLLSLYTPDTFKISPEYEKEYKKYVQSGEKHMKNSKIIICTLVRDVADRLPEIEKRSEFLGKEFLDYRIVVVENDSKDGTRKLLKEWRKRNPKVIILGCEGDPDSDECHISIASDKTIGHNVDRKRIEKMVFLRNIYLNYIRRNKLLSSFDYCTVWDLDIIGSVYLDGVANTIGHFSDRDSPAYKADAISSYGIYKWGLLTMYYDTYAHLDREDVFHIDLYNIHSLKKRLNIRYNRGDPPVKIISGFGGFTIYRIPSLLEENIKYDMSGSDNIECEHVRLNKKLHKVYLNPSMIHFVVLNR